MSSEEEVLAPAFAEAGWKKAAGGDDEFEEVVSPVQWVLQKDAQGGIEGILMNSGEAISKDLHPFLTFAFQPAELMKFEMPSILTGKKGEKFHLAAKSSLVVLNGTLKAGAGRWIFTWKNDDGTRTHQCSYTLHPKGCEVAITLEGLGVGPLVSKMKL
jgi:hypothetical protein